MKYKDLIQWNCFAEVEAYDENIIDKDGGKSICRTMLILRVLSFDEMINEIKEFSRNIYGGSDIYGGSEISGGSHIKYSQNCNGVYKCILCCDINGASLMIFNKPVSEERFKEVWSKLAWQPYFTNALELKEKYGNGDWSKTPAHAITSRSKREVYAEMPDYIHEYIKSMPEYDDDIFKKITGELE